jgi:hypothetical protein
MFSGLHDFGKHSECGCCKEGRATLRGLLYICCARQGALDCHRLRERAAIRSFANVFELLKHFSFHVHNANLFCFFKACPAGEYIICAYNISESNTKGIGRKNMLRKPCYFGETNQSGNVKEIGKADWGDFI